MPVKQLLAVDDEQDIVMLIKILLQKDGYAVDTATSAFDALELISSKDYALLITDLMMPGMDGFQLIKKVRQHYKKVIPALVVTAIKDPRLKLDADGLQDADILEKPFVRRTLAAAVRKLIGEPDSV